MPTNKIPNKLGQAGNKVSKLDTKTSKTKNKTSKPSSKIEKPQVKVRGVIQPSEKDPEFKLTKSIREHALYKKSGAERSDTAIEVLYKNCKSYNKKLVPGQMVIFEYMTPLMKEELDYYDARPCTIFFGSFNSSNGPREIGFNLHYYPPRVRFAIMNKIYDIYKPIFYKYFEDGVKKEIDGFDYKYLVRSLNKAGLGFGIREYVPTLRRRTILIEPKWFSTAVFTEGMFKKQALSQIMGHWQKFRRKDQSTKKTINKKKKS